MNMTDLSATSFTVGVLVKAALAIVLLLAAANAQAEKRLTPEELEKLRRFQVTVQETIEARQELSRSLREACDEQYDGDECTCVEFRVSESTPACQYFVTQERPLRSTAEDCRHDLEGAPKTAAQMKAWVVGILKACGVDPHFVLPK